MTIEDVFKQERDILKSEIDELETKFKDWVIGIMKDVAKDREAFPESVRCGFNEDVAINMLMTLKDFEFEQIKVLQQLSEKLGELWNLQYEDKLYGRHIA